MRTRIQNDLYGCYTLLTIPVKVQIEFHYHTKIQGSKNDKRKESDTFKDDSPMMKNIVLHDLYKCQN